MTSPPQPFFGGLKPWNEPWNEPARGINPRRSLRPVFPLQVQFVLPGIHQRLPRHGAAGLHHDHHPLHTGPVSRGDEEPEALLFAYRNKGIFYELVVNTILDDMAAVLRPRKMTVIGDFRRHRRHRHRRLRRQRSIAQRPPIQSGKRADPALTVNSNGRNPYPRLCTTGATCTTNRGSAQQNAASPAETAILPLP